MINEKHFCLIIRYHKTELIKVIIIMEIMNILKKQLNDFPHLKRL